MKIVQIATILNNVIKDEIAGSGAVVKEDLSNIVDVGKEVLDFTSQSSINFDSFINSLIDRVGKVVFVDRVYRSQAPSILKDEWEYGSILMKVRAEVGDYQENKSWELGTNSVQADGTAIGAISGSLDPFVITKPEAEIKFYNSKTTFELPITITEVALKEAFGSAAEMNRFIATIENRIQLKATLATDVMIQRTINNLVAQKIAGKHNVINLFAEFKAANPTTTLTAETALSDREFLQFAAKTIMLYKKYLNVASSKYNDAEYVTFTPDDKMKVVMLSEFAKSLEVYLYSDTYHNEFVKLDGYSEIPYWQGNANPDALNVDTLLDGTKTAANVDGLMAVIFDEQAAAVCNSNPRVTSIYNPRGEYWNYFYKYDCSYMNDTAENCIVFTCVDTE